MTAYNVVRFRVKPGMEEQFVARQREDLKRKMPGAIEAALIKTGERTYCFVGKWDTFDSIVAARPTMIGYLDDFRLMMVICLIAMPIILLLRSPNHQAGGGAATHAVME